MINYREAAAGGGSVNAGIIYGAGYGITPAADLAATELYDGSTWTAGAANPTANFNRFCGTQTATLAVANGPGATQTFDGSSWRRTEEAEVSFD